MKLHLERINKIQDRMRQSGFDYLFIGPTANMFYFSGLSTSPDERLQLLTIPADGKPFLLLPEMYRAAALSSINSGIELQTWPDSSDPFALVQGKLTGSKYGKVLVDDSLRADHLIGLMPAFADFELQPASNLVKTLRLYKDEDEIKSLSQAGNIADLVMEKASKEIHPGMMEKELALIIEIEYKKLADNISFKPIVASGPNAALPHHSPGEREINHGDFIIIDCGALYQGYCSDITRTFCLGKATDEMKIVYDTVNQANQAALNALKDNSVISCEKLDRISREVIASAGYGQHFIHRLGHGIGLEVHEEPYLVEGNDNILLAGMAFTIEPGIYISGEFGVRIEDTVVLTEDGPLSLTGYPKELIEL